MRVLCSPLGLGMQGGPLVPPAQQWGVWTCLTSRWAAPACGACANSSKNTKNTGWLVPQSARPGRPRAIIDAHA